MKYSPRTSVTSVLLTLAVPLGLALVPVQASAKGVDVTTPVTDRSDVLGSDAPAVRSAVSDFYDETGRKLFVVIVPTFGDEGAGAFIDDTVAASRLGSTDVVLAIATDTRQSDLTADPDDFSPADLERIRTETVGTAVAEGRWADAVTDGAEELAASRDAGGGLPWLWIVLAVLVVLAGTALAARRYRRRFERTHHVQDEHGRPIDPAAILADDEIEDAADRALVTVDDLLLASAEDLDLLEQDLGAPGRSGVAAWRVTLGQLRLDLDAALTRRATLDAEPAAARRSVSSELLSVCDRVDRTLDELAPDVRKARDLRARSVDLLTELEQRLDETTALETTAPDPLAQALEAAARAAVARARAADDAADRVADLRVAETATTRLAALALPGPSLEIAVAANRGAAGVLARARRSAGDEDGAREQLAADLATWERPDDGGIEGLWALARTGAVVEAPDQHRIGSVLGGSTHGSGSNTPFPGSERPDRFVATGFGGHRSVDRRPTITRL